MVLASCQLPDLARAAPATPPRLSQPTLSFTLEFLATDGDTLDLDGPETAAALTPRPLHPLEYAGVPAWLAPVVQRCLSPRPTGASTTWRSWPGRCVRWRSRERT